MGGVSTEWGRGEGDREECKWGSKYRVGEGRGATVFSFS